MGEKFLISFLLLISTAGISKEDKFVLGILTYSNLVALFVGSVDGLNKLG